MVFVRDFFLGILRTREGGVSIARMKPPPNDAAQANLCRIDIDPILLLHMRVEVTQVDLGKCFRPPILTIRIQHNAKFAATVEVLLSGCRAMTCEHRVIECVWLSTAQFPTWACDDVRLKRFGDIQILQDDGDTVHLKQWRLRIAHTRYRQSLIKLSVDPFTNFTYTACRFHLLKLFNYNFWLIIICFLSIDICILKTTFLLHYTHKYAQFHKNKYTFYFNLKKKNNALKLFLSNPPGINYPSRQMSVSLVSTVSYHVITICHSHSSPFLYKPVQRSLAVSFHYKTPQFGTTND